jgi:dienelactone hydrolase
MIKHDNMKKIKAFTLFMVGMLLLSSCIKEPVAPDNYQSSSRTGGAIEARYMSNGPYAVSKHENTVLQEFEKFIVYYPSELECGNQTWPVIVLCNGSGTPLSRYPAVAKHFASWGFIVVGTEENYSWNAFGAEMSIRYLERWNENETIEDTRSIFYHKVDFGNVGIVGHSQGGIGVFNAITETQHKDIYKTAVSLSPTNMELAHNLMWDYDVTKIEIPIMLMSGEGGGDDWVLTLDQLQAIYNNITSSKLMMRRVETVHNEMLYAPNGYVMAWFMWQLKNDTEAAKAFIGYSPEILSNPLYVDQQIDLE